MTSTIDVTIDDGECKSNHPQIPLIQVSELLYFTQMYIETFFQRRISKNLSERCLYGETAKMPSSETHITEVNTVVCKFPRSHGGQKVAAALPEALK